MKNAKNILITGGAGFIGNEIINQLIHNTESLVIIDTDTERLKNLSFKNIICLNYDCTKSDKILDTINTYSITRIIHLAANSDILNGSTNASLDFKDTLQTTIAISEILQYTNVEKILFSSSSAIYGVTNSPISMKNNLPKQPISNYGWAKLASEYILELTCIKLDIDLSILRFPNVVGPNPTHGILYDIKNKLKKNPDLLKIMGNGSQTKPYMHVEDLVKILLEIFKTNTGINKYNIGPIDTISVKEIIAIVLKVASIKPELEFGTTPEGWEGDVPNYVFDDPLPKFATNLNVRNSYDSVFDAFSEWWMK